MYADLNDSSVSFTFGTKKWHKARHDVFSSQFSSPCVPPETPQLNAEIAFAFLHALWTICTSQH